MMRITERTVLAALAVVLSGCGGGGGPEPEARPCPDWTQLATRAELDATPRVDEELELIALSLSSRLTAGEAAYEAVRRDVPAIRAAFPEVAHLRYSKVIDQPVTLRVDRDTHERMRAGAYDEWDCLNEFFDLTALKFDEPSADSYRLHLEFDGRYEFELLAALYRELPGVELASPNGPAGSRPSPQLCATIEAGANRYAFIDTVRCPECPTGGQEGWFDVVYLFVVEPGAAPRLESTWDSRTSEPRPASHGPYASCRRGLTY